MTQHILRFENGRAYSDEEIIFDHVCPVCKITGIPRIAETGEVWPYGIELHSSSKGMTAHRKSCSQI